MICIDVIIIPELHSETLPDLSLQMESRQKLKKLFKASVTSLSVFTQKKSLITEISAL